MTEWRQSRNMMLVFSSALKANDEKLTKLDPKKTRSLTTPHVSSVVWFNVMNHYEISKVFFVYTVWDK